jgi:hypothetical protein
MMAAELPAEATPSEETMQSSMKKHLSTYQSVHEDTLRIMLMVLCARMDEMR